MHQYLDCLFVFIWNKTKSTVSFVGQFFAYILLQINQNIKKKTTTQKYFSHLDCLCKSETKRGKWSEWVRMNSNTTKTSFIFIILNECKNTTALQHRTHSYTHSLTSSLSSSKYLAWKWLIPKDALIWNIIQKSLD